MVAQDEELMKVLVCPDCRSGMEHKDRRKAVVCLGCGLQYPVEDGIPVMLVEKSRMSRR